MSRAVTIEYRVRKVHPKGVTCNSGTLRTKSRNKNWIAWRIMKLHPGYERGQFSLPSK